jgi:hypothetical protein
MTLYNRAFASHAPLLYDAFLSSTALPSNRTAMQGMLPPLMGNYHAMSGTGQLPARCSRE